LRLVVHIAKREMDQVELYVSANEIRQVSHACY
jgi:hypothetical protein